jgi:hemoglobin-like flavoprotein
MHKNKRTKVLQVRLTESELEALEQAKGQTGTLARFAREKLLNQPANTQVVQAVATYADTVHQLKKIGTNINQIAHQLNSGEGSKVGGTIVELKKALADLRSLADQRVDEVLK